MDEFIEGWHRRSHVVLAEALAYLEKLERCPVSDGIFGDWIDVLCAFRFEPGDAPAIATLIARDDLLLQEAGIQLAAATGAPAQFASTIERRIANGVDPWVLEALVELLHYHPLPQLFPTLVRLHGTSPRGHGIMRNRHISPWSRLLHLYEQLMLQTQTPSPEELAFLPLVEAKHHTRGWAQTVRAIRTALQLP